MSTRRRSSLIACLLSGLAACAGTDSAGGSSTGSTGTTSTGEPPGEPTGAPPPDLGDVDPTTGGGSTDTTAPGDGSSTTASFLCGDGQVDPGEGCDEGADNGPFAACTDACQLNVCGDGKVLLGVEGCDEGANNLDSGYCRADCQLGVCGDGFVLVGLEECDAGAGSDKYGACDAACTINRCGDGELDAGFEECDAGPDNGSGGGGEFGKAGCDLECGLAGRRIFLSSQSFTGDMGTRAGADLACQNMAAKFKHPKRYRALLADAEADPWDFVLADLAGRPFILPSGLIIAADLAALIDDGPGAGITMTETGEIFYEWEVWTNLNPAGGAYLKDAASTCGSWSSQDVGKSARLGLNAPAQDDAAALAEWQNGKQWLSYLSRTCSKPARIYCIEAS